MGKFAFQQLSKILECIAPSPKAIIPPEPGLDAGVYAVDDERYLVVSTDPCTGVPEGWFGWLLLHYSASDVTLFGARPDLAAITLLGPPGTSPRVYRRIMSQACEAAEDLNIEIITGHTGNYSSLSQLVGVCTVTGFVKKEKLITPSGSKPGDLLLMVKPLGLETLTNYSLTHPEQSRLLFGAGQARRLRSLISSQTCVEEAIILSGTGGVHALHDTTEGGVVAALNEMADTSGLGFDVCFESLPIPEELKRLQNRFNLSLTELLSTSSTGSLLASISSSEKGKVEGVLTRKAVPYRIVGRFREKGAVRVLRVGGKRRRFPSKARDPYAKIFCSPRS